MTLINLAGKTALITGGSRGVGRATAQLLARSGAKIGITYRTRENDANETLESVIAYYKTRTLNLPMRLLEGGLYECNLADENKDFFHPEGLTFDQFLDTIKVGRWEFNKDYNYYEENK